MAYKRSRDPHLTPAQAELFDEVDQLVRILRVRENRDKLDDNRFTMATSMVERWKWNSRVIQGEDLRHFAATAREFVKAIGATDRRQKRAEPKP